MNRANPGELRSAERWLLRAEEAPWSMLWRAVVGYLAVPTFRWAWGEGASAWKFVGHLLLLLLMLRVAPAALRRFLPVARQVRSVWAARRLLGKRYDSYQWRKLLGIGAGLLAGCVFSAGAPRASLGLALVCLISGGVGAAVWRRQSAGLPSEAMDAAQAP